MMRTVRYLLNVHNAIRSWQEANIYLKQEALITWMGANNEIVEFMSFIWSLEDNG